MEPFSEHFKKEHFLSKADARLKLLVVFALLMMVLNYKGLLFPLLIAVSCFLVCLKMRVPSRVFLLRFSQPVFIASALFILKLFFSGEEALFSINIFGLEIIGHKDGLIEGFSISSRIMGGVSLVVVLGFATPFAEFIAVLSWFRVPKQFVEIMVFAYRYTFVFFEDALTIYNAQKNRLGYVSVRKGLHSFGILTGALVLRGFEQSQKISEAMIQRGYTGSMPFLQGKPLKTGEVVLAATLLIFAGAIWMI